MDIAGILQNIGFDWRVFLFNLINFLVIMLLLKKFFFGKIAYILQERKRLVEESESKANELTKELEAIEKKRNEVLKKAETERKKILEDANNLAAIESKDTHTKALTEARRIIDESKKSAEVEKVAILEEVKKEVAEIVTDELKNKITK